MTPDETRRLSSLEVKQDTQTELLKEIRDDVKDHGKAVVALTTQVSALTKANLPERIAKAETKIKLSYGIGSAGIITAIGMFIKSILPL